MSDSPTAAPEPGGPPTRQQLDELEALMERMLALPLHPAVDDAPTALPAPAPPAVIESPPRFVYRLAETPEPPPSVVQRETAASTPPAPPSPPLTTPVTLLQANRDSPREVRPAATPAKVVVPAVRRLPRPPSVWWLRPLVGVNRVFDRATRLLGRPGVWLRGRVGRAWLGIVGLVLLTAALVWVAIDLSGWTW